MTKKIIQILLLLLTPIMARAQRMDVENAPIEMAQHMSSLYNYLTQLTDSTDYLYKHIPNRIQASFTNDNSSGQFVHYLGKRHTFGQLLAQGQLHIKESGTLYGQASYQSGRRTQTSYSYSAYPEEMRPYLVSDTLGATTMDIETYHVLGGYSFNLGKYALGTEVDYEGIALSRSNDPRLANYAHHIRMGLACSRVYAHDILAIKFSPEWIRESISANSIMDGVKYFQFYGFGLWNRRETQGAITYGRQQTQLSIGTDAAWFHKGTWNWALHAFWKYSAMNCEEANFKELFTSRTHHFQQQLLLSRQFTNSSLHFQFSAQEHLRKGSEAVYQQQIQDAQGGLYDYVKVGSNDLYANNWQSADIKMKYIQNLTPTSSLDVFAGFTYNHFEEKYKSPIMKIENQTTSALLGVGYQSIQKSLQWKISVYASTQGGTKNTYSIPGNADKTQLTMAYIPYLLRGENHQTAGASVQISVPVKAHQSVGFYFAQDYLNSDYRQQMVMTTGLFYLF